MEWITQFLSSHSNLLFLIAGVSLLVELSVMGLSGPLLFFGLACFVAGALSAFGVISGWEAEISAVGIITGLFAVFLWKPLKRFQDSGGGPDTSSDMIGKAVPCAEEVSAHAGAVRYSGVNWPAKLAPSHTQVIPAGEQCKIIEVNGTTMIVAPLD